MLKVKTTPNLYGVTLMGDYEDLDKLYDSISRYLEFYQDNHDKILPHHEYEYLLSLNYDIRHCYQGDRGYETVENNADRYGEMAGVIYELPDEIKSQFKKVYEDHKNGNLYYTVEILYPLIFHYIIHFERLLEDEPEESWLETEREFSGKWKDHYSIIDAIRDRGQLMQFTGLLWDNLQELLGREKANAIYDYYLSIGFPAPSALYCDALLHCQLVNFDEMTNEEKLDYHMASIYEIIDVEDIKRYGDIFNESANHYINAITNLNKKEMKRFPVRSDFYDGLDKIFEPGEPLYRDSFEGFLNDTYGKHSNPFETGDFQW